MAGNNGNSGGHRGAERRRAQRRHGKDRRDLVRWEPKKGDRRRGYGRRNTDSPLPQR